MTSRKRQNMLNLIKKSKEMINLEDENLSKSRSQLSKLSGINKERRERVSILQSASIGSKRPIFARIADNVLGKPNANSGKVLEINTSEAEDASKTGTWIQSRIEFLREEEKSEYQNVSESASWLGHNDVGEPFWKQVLEERRGSATWVKQTPEIEVVVKEALPSLNDPYQELAKWPPILPHNDLHTFKNFQVCRENEIACHAVNEILDHPANTINPLVIYGDKGVGKTHLLWATGWAFSRQSPSECVRLFSPSTMDKDFELPENWQEMLKGTSALLIDDIHHLFAMPNVMHSLGLVIDWAINLGIQIVLTSEITSSNIPANRFKDVMNWAVNVNLHSPSNDSLMMMMRQQTSRKRLLLNDSMLQFLVNESSPNWASCQANLEKIGLAINSGYKIENTADLSLILQGSHPDSNAQGRIRKATTVRELSKEGEIIATKVLDSVFADPLSPIVDLHTELPEIGSDAYDPPNLMPESSEAAIHSIVQRHLGDELKQLNVRRDHSLTVDERDAHLVVKPPQLSKDIREQVADQLSPLGYITDDGFERINQELISHQEQLFDLERQLLEIGKKVEVADSKELIILTDQLRDIQVEITTIDPDALPLPEFVDTKIRNRPTRKRARKPIIERLPVLSPRPILPVKKRYASIEPVKELILKPLKKTA